MSDRLEISGCYSGDHRHRGNAVRGVQEAGRELSQSFARLRKRSNARKLVAAIRHCDFRAVNRLLDRDCRAVCFFKKPGYDCVKIACGFGRNNSAIVNFDICVRSLRHRCGGGCGGGCGFY
ncbi:hypothetical protein RB620_18080 [Paenibacillus sp. LHD-117]|uniref:hypothetical protein n=1 Tax=Paenibacillus sp. LHD-117 TaxID=3071412 RepID=UPI0027E16CA4|nr:hypothetical protein [Paenibacillus sp. LHD-117]MDQ6421338.1 hypothetical protein [Paenibacillus sp. LHD-117]